MHVSELESLFILTFLAFLFIVTCFWLRTKLTLKERKWRPALIVGIVGVGVWTWAMVGLFEMSLLLVFVILIPWASLALTWKWSGVGGVFLIIAVFLPLFISELGYLEEQSDPWDAIVVFWFLAVPLILVSSALIIFSTVSIRSGLRRLGRYLWATKYRRVGVIITPITLILVVVIAVMWIQYEVTFNVLHYDGDSWSTMSSGTTATLSGVWGSSSSDVFAVGSYVGNYGPIMHYDGTTWRKMSSGGEVWLMDVWGSSSSDVFAVGSGGTIMHCDGSSWSKMSSGTKETLRGVWGSSASDVFAVGSGGTILHYDGSSWSKMSSGGEVWLEDVWGSSESDVFIVGGRK